MLEQWFITVLGPNIATLLFVALCMCIFIGILLMMYWSAKRMF